MRGILSPPFFLFRPFDGYLTRFSSDRGHQIQKKIKIKNKKAGNRIRNAKTNKPKQTEGSYMKDISILTGPRRWR